MKETKVETEYTKIYSKKKKGYTCDGSGFACSRRQAETSGA